MQFNLVTFALSLASLLPGGAYADYLDKAESVEYKQGMHVGAVLLNDAPVIVDIGRLGDGLLASGAGYFTAANFTTNSAVVGANSLDLSINHELRAGSRDNASTATFDMKTLVNLDGYMGDGGKLSVYASAPVNFGVGLHINANQGLSLGDPVRIKASVLYKAFDVGSSLNQSSHAFISFFLNEIHIATFSGQVSETSFLAYVGDTIRLFGRSQSKISIAEGHYARGDVVTVCQSSAMEVSFTVSSLFESEFKQISLPVLDC
jgi:hypothetical protein